MLKINLQNLKLTNAITMLPYMFFYVCAKGTIYANIQNVPNEKKKLRFEIMNWPKIHQNHHVYAQIYAFRKINWKIFRENDRSFDSNFEMPAYEQISRKKLGETEPSKRLKWQVV